MVDTVLLHGETEAEADNRQLPRLWPAIQQTADHSMLAVMQ